MNYEDDKKRQLQRLFQQALDFSSRHDYSSALNLFIQMLEIEPAQPHVMFNAAAMCDMLGETQTAIQVIKEALKINPQLTNAHLYLGKIYYRFKDYAAAVNCFRNTINYDIKNDEAFNLYRLASEKLGCSVSDDQTDIVFYIIGGRSFNGNSMETEGLGGSESALIYIARGLAQSGFRIKVFTMCDQPGMYHGVGYFDLVDFYIHNYFNPINIFISVRSIKPFQVGVNAKKKILWIHDNPNVEMTADIIDQLDKIFAISEWQKQQWMEKYQIPESKFFIARNGIDLSLFKNIPAQPRRNKLIYSSQPQRGLEILLSVFPRIRHKCPDAELHVFSYMTDDFQPKIEAICKEKDLTGVHIRGSIPKQQLAEEYTSSRIFVYPTSCLENSCIAAMEAQAAGTPVISSHLAALPETIEHNKTGFLIKGIPDSREYQNEFIERTIELLQNDKKWQEVNKSCHEASRSFDWDRIIKQWDKELKKIQSG